MIAEIKHLNPKPGLAFASGVVQPIVPDVFVRQGADGAWLVELNYDTLPRVLVNQTYYAKVSKTAKKDNDKSYLAECLQTATWLVRALDQRAKTILKVASEIVRQQDAFLAYGVQHLRPLNLKTIADAIEMHESTVSRVTANKYMATSRGIFEMKFFFTASIAATDGGEAHSAEAVRHRIKQLIDAEAADDILSDDTIVEKLREAGIDIARRTVAKYREAMRIASSVQRRRDKGALNGAGGVTASNSGCHSRVRASPGATGSRPSRKRRSPIPRATAPRFLRCVAGRVVALRFTLVTKQDERFTRPGAAPAGSPFAVHRARRRDAGRPCRSGRACGRQFGRYRGMSRPPGGLLQRRDRRREVIVGEKEMPFPRASKALSRFTVLDLTRVRAGPTCVRQLADWGANVIKIETPAALETGEPLGGPRDGPDFMNLHRNKRSITLNLKAPEGVAAFKKMVEEGRRGGRELPARRQGTRWGSTTRRCARSIRASSMRAFPASARPVPMPSAPASTRSPRAWAG